MTITITRGGDADDNEEDGDYSFFGNLNIGIEDDGEFMDAEEGMAATVAATVPMEESEDESEDHSKLALAHKDERYQGLNPDWILLDNQSTSNLFCNL